jgi:AAA domain
MTGYTIQHDQPPGPWWRNPADIPPRQTLYDHHYVRGAIGATIAAGGRCKTTLACTEAVSMAVGRNLMTSEVIPGGRLRVLMWNGEEDQDEMDRRIAAVCQRYSITRQDLSEGLFVISVRDKPMRLARIDKNGPKIDEATFEKMKRCVTDQRIDVFMIDPLVSFHSLPENDNGAMDVLVKEGFGAIARATNSAGELFHHSGKPKPGQTETTVEDGRGASAILWAVRSARVLNFMTPEEAARLGIGEDDRRLHIRVANGKANFGPLGRAKWMKIEVENLPNGDQIACAISWTPQNAFRGVTTADMHECRKLAQTGAFRTDIRSPSWVGYMVAEVLKIDATPDGPNDPKDIARIKEILRIWFKNKVFDKQKRLDGGRKEREFVIPGSWTSDAAPARDPDEYTLQ